MSLHVLAYNVKRLMTLLGVAGMMEAIRAYALLLALQRVFRANTLRIRSVSPKTRHCSLSTLKSRTTRIGGYSFTARACF
jgi:transposase